MGDFREDEERRGEEIAADKAILEAKEKKLAKLEAAFEAAGGRGIELADQIDELREEIEEMSGYVSDSIPEMDVFVVRIRLGNERMCSPTDISEALMRVSSQVQWSEYTPGGKQILDANGNTVGSWAIYERSHEPNPA